MYVRKILPRVDAVLTPGENKIHKSTRCRPIASSWWAYVSFVVDSAQHREQVDSGLAGILLVGFGASRV
jgi:hypothetical protein